MRTDVLTAWLPLLARDAVADGRLVAASSVTRAAAKLRLLRRWAILRESEGMTGVSDNAVFAMVAAAAREADPDLRVSVRSLRRWRDQHNAIGPDGLRAGPAALFPKYTTPPRPGKHRRSTAV